MKMAGTQVVAVVALVERQLMVAVVALAVLEVSDKQELRDHLMHVLPTHYS